MTYLSQAEYSGHSLNGFAYKKKPQTACFYYLFIYFSKQYVFKDESHRTAKYPFALWKVRGWGRRVALDG